MDMVKYFCCFTVGDIVTYFGWILFGLILLLLMQLEQKKKKKTSIANYIDTLNTTLHLQYNTSGVKTFNQKVVMNFL